ncbi:MAG TPA: NAD(P)H-binding protein [Vicinamibacterales bacterium]|nr:NAD(P)H-binding protein [Vicinamibacterales bacterium]
MILVTAATGQYGRLVVEALLQKVAAKDLAVAVRHPEKARDWRTRGVSVRQADYDDLSSLHAAFEGINDVLLVSSPEFDTPTRMAQHERVIEGAKRAKARHVAYTSFVGAQNEQPGGFNAHYLTERALEKSGLTITFLRHPFYTDSLVNQGLLQDAIATGRLKDASGGKAINTASRADLAAAAATVLTGTGEKGKPVELTGTPWTFAQLAEAVSRATGRSIAIEKIPSTEAGPYGWLFDLIAAGLYERETPDLSRLLGRKPTSLGDFVASLVRATSGP